MDEASLRRALTRAGARLGARRLIAAGEGNLSVRLGEHGLLITPAGRRKDELAPDDIVLVGLEPGERDTADPAVRPSSDVAIHRAIYRARPDVAAVVHAHLPASMALTAAGERPDPSLLPETGLLLPVLPVVPFAAMGSAELAALVAAALTSGDPAPQAVVLERHGALAIGESRADQGAALAAALNRIELIDVLCRVTRDTLLLKSARRTLG